MTKQDFNNFAEKFYLDYFNHFLSVSEIASHYAISENTARELIEEGKYIHLLKHGEL